MSYPLRIQRDDLIYFVTNRCTHEMFLLRPCPVVNAIILGCLARAVAKHGIEMIGFVFMGNHFHLIFRAPGLNMGEFMRDFESWLAGKIKRHLKTTSTIFSRRYRSVDILDDATAFDKLIYVLANPCASDLVDKPEQYPGLSSLSYQLEAKPVCGRWIEQEKLTRNRKRNKDYDEEKAASYHSFELAVLPFMADLSVRERAAKIARALEGACGKLRRARGSKRVVGARRLQAIDPFSRPKEPAFSVCPPSLSQDKSKIEEHREHRANTTRSYYRARSHDRDPRRASPAKYPPGTTPPGHQRCVGYPTPSRKTAMVNDRDQPAVGVSNAGADARVA
ncbi:MAG: hypothetical protein H0U74_18750 [Bradymonadaceae bacterium]|nr:hypothetical protein [Lujinxingiaceae bacterium]